MGACGIYQQIPKWSPIKTTCKKLNKDVDHSTKVAVATLGRMIDRWDIKGSKNMDKRMCHYYSGNKCDDEARAYGKRHRKIRLKAITLSKKKTKVAKKSKSKKSNTNSKPKSTYRMPPRYMAL
jgi:homospermidine synthase